MKTYKILIFILLLSLCLLYGCSSNESVMSGENSSDEETTLPIIADTEKKTTLINTTSPDKEKTSTENLPSVDIDSASQINSQRSKEHITSLKDQISMSAVMDSSGNLNVTIINNSDTIITFGNEYQLQKLEDNSWKDIPLSIVFTDIGIEVASGESYDFQYPIGTLTALESNTIYRIIKNVYINQSNFELTASFEVK